MRNLEAKFEVRDPSAAQIAAIAIGYKPTGFLTQRDTHFRLQDGRLLLREEDERAYLVGCRRRDQGTLQLCDYRTQPVHDATGLRDFLAATLGVVGEVRKRRTRLLRDNLRLHLDEVDGLGFFGEIEAQLDDDADLAEETRFIERTLRALKVERNGLVHESYVELLQRRRAPGALP